MREVREEAGIVARPVGLVARVGLPSRDKRVDVKFYLMESMFETAANEGREKQWCSFKKALELLTFPESLYVLKEGERRRGGDGDGPS